MVYYLVAVEKYKGQQLAHHPKRIETDAPRFNSRSEENPDVVTWDYIYFSYESDANRFFNRTNTIKEGRA